MFFMNVKQNIRRIIKMKKIYTLLIFIIVISLTACGVQDLPDNPNSDSVHVENKFNSYISNADIAYDSETMINDNIFIVKTKKLEFEKSNVLLLNIENKSEKDYTLSISVTYCDAEGNILKIDTKRFEGFASNFINNFVFQPGIVFEEAKVEIVPESFSSKSMINNLIMEWMHYDTFTIMGETHYKGRVRIENSSEDVFKIKTEFILFDESDNIVSIAPMGKKLTANFSTYADIAFAITPEDTEAFWNKNLLDQYSYLVCINEAVEVTEE